MSKAAVLSGAVVRGSLLLLGIGAGSLWQTAAMANAQQPGAVIRTPDQKEYELALDRLFPVDLKLQPRVDALLIIRYKPGLLAECQLSIPFSRAGANTTARWECAQRNVYGALSQAVEQTASSQFEELAAREVVARQTIRIGRSEAIRVHALFRQGIQSLASDWQRKRDELTTTVVLDGTSYDVWYSDGVSTMRLSLTEDAFAPEPQANWLEAIKRRVVPTLTRTQ